MAITLVNSAESSGFSDSSPLTFAFTVDSMTNGLLIVSLCIDNNIDITFSSPTWNSVAMGTGATNHYNNGASWELAEQYYLVNPDAGNHTFSVNHGGINYFWVLFAAWFNNANQTQGSVLDNSATGEGTTDPSMAITPTENNCLIVGQYVSKANDVLTVGSGETEINNVDFGGSVSGQSYAVQTTASAQTVDWSGADDIWSGVACSYKAAAAAAAAIGQARVGRRSGIGGGFGARR